MNKQPERTEKTKQALIDAFWDLYKEKRIEKITVKEITANAGFYRSTFYEYFGSVYDVLEEVEQDLMDKFLGLLPKVFTSDTVEEGLKHVAAFYEKNGEYAVVLLRTSGEHSFQEKIKQMVKELIAGKSHFDTKEYHLELSIELMASVIISMLHYWYNHRDELSVEEVLTASKNILQKGALPYLQTLGLEIKW